MRRLSFAFLAAVLLATASRTPAADAEFLRVWPGWREAASFERIGQYFGQDENHGREIVRRTHDDARAGYYFLVRVKHAASLAGAKFALDVIRPDAPAPLHFVFPASEAAAGESVFDLGLTGADWPGGKSTEPVAWKLALLAADGRVLAEQKSFLWEKPAR
ncbi:MAG TPA: hypothetical protein VHD62_18310 [Opitutaceae bacterium]|nr:hypothetical protein [Opitutaceae bacterium]